MTKNPKTAAIVHELGGAQAALEQLLPTLEKMPSASLRTSRSTSPEVVSAMIEVARAFAEDQGRFEAIFPKTSQFDLRAIADLRTRALALWQADLRFRQAVDPEGSLDERLEEARPLRKRLLRAAEYLWDEDRELAKVVADIRAGAGHMDTADDLVALSTLFTNQWSGVVGRCDVTPEEVKRSRELGVAIMDALQGANGPSPVAKARDLRNRAYTYAMIAYEEIREAAAFVFRREPDQLDRYPSFAARARGRRRRAEDPSGGTGVGGVTPITGETPTE